MELRACDPDLEKTWTTTGQDDLLWQCIKPTFISSFPVKPKVKEWPTVKQYYMKFPPKIVLRDSGTIILQGVMKRIIYFKVYILKNKVSPSSLKMIFLPGLKSKCGIYFKLVGPPTPKK